MKTGGRLTGSSLWSYDPTYLALDLSKVSRCLGTLWGSSVPVNFPL